ncbi:MAG: FixH family protein [Gammaproteobacteria bacterium]|nr:FixH family protein [Gammaproteobacteria bacterium]NNJ92122.1 FixH family protein [Gammaproteobacteria bacterium]
MNDINQPKAWYKQFWPWFLIALPMTAVIGSMITINIAFTDADGLVKDDYYKEGLAMNMDIARKQNAENLGVTATTRFNLEQGNISVTLNDASVGNLDKLLISLIHPTRSDNDMNIMLQKTGERQYQGKIEQKVNPGNWWVRISPENDSWYIEGRLYLPKKNQLELK